MGSLHFAAGIEIGLIKVIYCSLWVVDHLEPRRACRRSMGWHWGRWRSPLPLASVPCFNIPSWQHSILMGNMTRSSCPGACVKPEQSMRHIHNWNGIKDSQNETPLGTASGTHWHLDMGLCGMTLPIFLTAAPPPPRPSPGPLPTELTTNFT